MSTYPQFIDNKRKTLAETLRMIAPDYNVLRIATGYWDLPGTLEIINEIKNYQKIFLLIGQEPLAHHLQKKFNIQDDDSLMFPDSFISSDLEGYGELSELDQLRDTSRQIVSLIRSGVLEVKVFRKPRLHAKTYIFGELGDGKSVGIIGSSNFTKAGLTTSQELNFLTDNYKIVEFEPKSNNQENGHITWFNELWNDESAEDWNGDFSEIIANSPVGDKTYGPYDVYIKTLMEVFPDEMQEVAPFDEEIEKILHPFQYENALSLRRKLDNMGVAMLSDSVGLGKTITASAIIKQYINEGYVNIVVIPPASLKQQWINELQNKERWNLVLNRDFRIISQQDRESLEALIEDSESRKNTTNEINLFVIDEAHNLRNSKSKRHEQILRLFQENPNAKVLLLTATPINNSLIDFSNQIQLGSKGKLSSVNVPYSTESTLEYLDFFEVLKRIQSQVTKAEKAGKKINWNKYKNSLSSGIRHYLVRATRQGVIKRNAMKNHESRNKMFPDSRVEQFSYSYNRDDENMILAAIDAKINFIFEGLDPKKLNLNLVSDITQRTLHPIDLYKKILNAQTNNSNSIGDEFNISKKYMNESIFVKGNSATLITLLFQLINFIGFVPYKPDSYRKIIYGKSISEINAKKIIVSEKYRAQLSIHNMLHITWLKRLESSLMALLKSVENYKNRLDLFEKWIDRGFIVYLDDITLLETEYGDDIEKAFDDFEKYLKDIDESINNEEIQLKKKGIEKNIADENVYEIKKLKTDIQRDRKIIDLLSQLLQYFTEKDKDEKLNVFCDKLVEKIKSEQYGKKVLVFSFFADTIKYLEERLPGLLQERLPDFNNESAFIYGNGKDSEDAARRFSPKSKGYKLKKQEKELNYLFATDVLSEGQNLQDAGILVNFDLHWNPVRMIQRNGRINRLGSKYETVLIANSTPNDDLENYLNLVRRLERKIDTINSTVGNDQSILGEEANPIEFNDYLEFFNNDSSKASIAISKLENGNDPLDWVDDFSQDLRNFIEQSDDEEIERIKSIPLGKWNYLPKRNNEMRNPVEVIGLYKTNTNFDDNYNKVESVGFVKIAPSGKNRGPFSTLKGSYIEEQEALHLIKTLPDDNSRTIDAITVNRAEYISKGKEEIKVHFTTIKENYDLKPSAINTLSLIGQYFNLDLLGIIQKNINRSNEKSEFENLIRKINKELKLSGSPNTITLKKFENFINKLVAKNERVNKVKEIKGVLFYAQPE